jgi:hypothetical protein
VLGALVTGCTLGAVNWDAASSGASIIGTGSSVAGATTPGAAAAASGVAPQASSFSISGGVKGLYPGKAAPLVLTVSNPLELAITVTSLTTTVSAIKATCGAANVTVTRFVGNLRVAARHKGIVHLRATMGHAAPNACQGATFTFHYRGLAKAA